jgi:TonB family protein
MTFHALFTILSLGLLAIATSGFPRKMGQPPATNAKMQESATPVARSEQTSATTAANPPAASVPSYPDTTQGLEKLMKDMMKLEKHGDQRELAAYIRSMALPDVDNWFKSVFGDYNGAALASASERGRKEFESLAPNTLATFLKQGLTEVESVRFDDSCNRRGTATEYPLLLLRVRPEPLFDVRFLGGTTGTLLAYFAYVDGAFRYVGNLKKASAVNSSKAGEAQSAADNGGEMEGDPKKTVKIGNEVQMPSLIYRETPEYPPDAKAAGIKGVVILHAIIAKDGSVKNLEVTEGVCSFAESALLAVKKWRYKPTLLNGDPIEVDTTINVVFTLGNH